MLGALVERNGRRFCEDLLKMSRLGFSRGVKEIDSDREFTIKQETLRQWTWPEQKA